MTVTVNREVHARLEPWAKGMRDEPRGLEENRGCDTVIDAEPDREGAFAREEFWGTWMNERVVSGGGLVPGSGYTSTEAIHVEATTAAYSCSACTIWVEWVRRVRLDLP